MSEAIKKFYNKHPDFGVNSTRRSKINNLIKDEITRGNKSVLDVGCASGYLSAPFRESNNYITGIDIAEKNIIEARKKLDEACTVDIENYPWPSRVTNKKYDIIICAELIEHLFEPEKLLAYIKGLLSEDGVVVITTPNFLVWSDRIKMLLGYYRFTDEGHIRFFSYKTLLDLFRKTGLQVCAENHSIHGKIPEFIGRLMPNLFSYQIIVKLKAKDFKEI